MAAGQSSVEANLTALLADAIGEFGVGTGAQLSVFLHGDEMCTLSLGDSCPGHPMQPATIHNVWCASKPVHAVALLHRLWESDLADAHLGRLLGEAHQRLLPSFVSGVTPAELLGNAVGLAEPHVLEAMLCEPAERHVLLLRALHLATPAPAAGTYAPWKVAEWVTTDAFGVEPNQLVHEWLAEHLRYADEIRFTMSEAELAQRREQIGPYIVSEGGMSSVAYLDRRRSIACEDRLAVGGFASMRALAEFFALVAKGSSLQPAFLNWLHACPEARMFDPAIDATTGYRAGFVSRLSGLEDAVTCSAAGLLGTSFGFASHDLGIAGAFMTNGAFADRGDIDFFRIRLTRAILRSCAKS
jgi:hypothetical protein